MRHSKDFGIEPAQPDSLLHEPIETALADDAADQMMTEVASAESALEFGCRVLVERFGQKLGRVSEAVGGVHRKTVLKRVRAAAEAVLVSQSRCLQSVFDIVKDLVELNQCRPLVFLERLAYDETKLDARVYYDDEAGATREAAAVWVVEQSWSMVLEHIPFSLTQEAETHPASRQLTIIEGHHSPSVRCAQAATGECIAQVLGTILSPPAGTTALFKHSIRLAETDQDGANARGEAILLNDRKQVGQEFAHITSHCLAHKVHSSATRSWALQEHVVTGVIHTCKVLGLAGSMRALRTAMGQLLSERLMVVPIARTSLPETASTCRRQLVDYFAPPPQQTRKRAAFNAAIAYFNSDWRSSEVVHRCGGLGCCDSSEASLAKAKKLLQGLLKAAAPRMFSRSNWVGWHSAMSFFGVAAGIHGLLLDSFHFAFRATPSAGPQVNSVVGAGGSNQEPEQSIPDEFEVHPAVLEAFAGSSADPHRPNDPDGPDTQEVIREQNAQSMRIALRFMTRGVLECIWLLRISLDPQRELMATLLHTASSTWEESELQRLWDTGARQYRGLWLHRGEFLQHFFQKCGRTCSSPDLWLPFPSTFEFRSKVFRCCWRPAAVVYQLVQVRVRCWPLSSI